MFGGCIITHQRHALSHGLLPVKTRLYATTNMLQRTSVSVDCADSGHSFALRKLSSNWEAGISPLTLFLLRQTN